MKFCVYCGKRLVKDAKFCVHCGSQVPTSSPVRPDASADLPLESGETQRSENGPSAEVPKSSTEPSKAVAHCTDPETKVHTPIPITEVSVRKAVEECLLTQPSLPKTILLFEKARKVFKKISLQLGEIPIAFFGKKCNWAEYGYGVLFTNRTLYYSFPWLTRTKGGSFDYDEIRTLGVLEDDGTLTFCVNDVPVGDFNLSVLFGEQETFLKGNTGELLTQFCQVLSPLPFRSLENAEAVDSAAPTGATPTKVVAPADTLGATDTEACVEALLRDKKDVCHRPAVVTVMLVLTCVAGFAAQLWMGGFEDDASFLSVVTALGGGFPILGGIVCAFLHSDWLHLLLCMVALWSFGCATEKIVGHWAFLFVYLATTMSGEMLSAAFRAPDVISVGASGGIYGLMGFLVAYIALRISRLREEKALSPIRLHLLRKWCKGMAIALGSAFLGGLSDNVDIASHVGGAVGGLMLGGIFYHCISESDKRQTAV